MSLQKNFCVLQIKQSAPVNLDNKKAGLATGGDQIVQLQ
jgi:hypothetical protein